MQLTAIYPNSKKDSKVCSKCPQGLPKTKVNGPTKVGLYLGNIIDLDPQGYVLGFFVIEQSCCFPLGSLCVNQYFFLLKIYIIVSYSMSGCQQKSLFAVL